MTSPAERASAPAEASPAGPIAESRHETLVGFIDEIASSRALFFDSLLEVGPGARPLDRWFAGWSRADAPARYVAVDVDPQVVETLKDRAPLIAADWKFPFDMTSDLVIAADVLEYLTPHRALRFLERCAASTGRMFALSTLNAEHWGRSGAKREHRAVRWLPDMLIACWRDADDLHRIRNTVAAPQVADLMAEAFPDKDWEVQIVTAQPWELTDVARQQTHRFTLKTFAVAVRRA